MASSELKDNFEEISKYLRCKKSEIFGINRDNLIQNENENENYSEEDTNVDSKMPNNEPGLACGSDLKFFIRVIKNLAENLSLSKPDRENLNGIEDIFTFLKINYKNLESIQADLEEKNILKASNKSNNLKGKIELYRSKSCSFQTEITKSSVNILLL